MFHSNHHSLVHLPGKPTPAADAPLPRGECTKILSEAEAGGVRQRCPCRTFISSAVVRTHCGCGHQAWFHESEPISQALQEEYAQVIEEVKQLKQEIRRREQFEHDLKQELFKERMARDEHFRLFKGIEARMYENMLHMKVQMDDKVEAVVDKTQEFNDQIKALQERLTMVDEVSMDMENRIDHVEMNVGLSREPTPGASTPKAIISTAKTPPVPPMPTPMAPHHIMGQLPIRNDKKYPISWSVRVIFVPRKAQKYAYDPDSVGYKRCASRKLQQNLDFPSQDSSCFANRVENAFKGIFRARPWMPMSAHRPSDEPFGRMALSRLPPDLVHRDVWDYPFLEDHCIAHDKMQGDVLYVTLQYEDVTWNEIRFLPPVMGADDSCWQHDEELDGHAKYKSLDSEIMYDYPDPPPTYQSRTHSLADRTPSKLDVLADSASLRSPIERVQSLSSRFSSERSSLRSFESGTTEETDDEHRDKKPKLRIKQSMPVINGAGHVQQPMYVSGRSKRKMPQKGPKEPLHFNVTKWRPAILNPHSKGKEAAHDAASRA